MGSRLLGLKQSTRHVRVVLSASETHLATLRNDCTAPHAGGGSDGPPAGCKGLILDVNSAKRSRERLTFHKRMVTPRQGRPRDLPEFTPRDMSPTCSLLGDTGDPMKSSVEWKRDFSTSNPYVLLHGPFADFCFKDCEAHQCAWDTQAISKGSLSQITIERIILWPRGYHSKGFGKCSSVISQRHGICRNSSRKEAEFVGRTLQNAFTTIS